MQKIFGSPAVKVITKTFNEDLEKQNISFTSNSYNDQILNQIHKNNISDFFGDVQSHQNIALFFKNLEFLEFTFNRFIQTNKTQTPVICISNSGSEINTSKNMKINDLIIDNQIQTDKIIKEVIKLHSTNKTSLPTLVMCQGGSWLIEHEYYLNYFTFREFWRKLLTENVSCLFPYDFSKMNQKNIEKIIEFHDQVITEFPSMIYEKQN